MSHCCSRRAALLCTLLTAWLSAGSSLAATDDAEAAGGRFTFSWPYIDGDQMRPRGGTTKGPPVELLQKPSADFQRIGEDGLSPRERDRRAILAMAGPYRVSFDFLEVVGYEAAHEPPAPYQSWATEYVYVIADNATSISLQHLLVMSIVDDNGALHGPFVTKHWRQDWHFEADSVHVYRGANTWQRESVGDTARAGRWLQTVWQVDDSPRYAAWGRWRHEAGYSSWLSDETWRPLPRREYSVRDDYDALLGTNRHVVLPTGWVQEERNEKVVVGAPGEIGRRIALEYGIARYERIEGYDFAPGDAYLEATAAFWSLVRDYWDELLASQDTIHLRAPVDEAGLFRPLFARAQAIADGEDAFDAAADARFVRDTVDGYLAEVPERGSGY